MARRSLSPWLPCATALVAAVACSDASAPAAGVVTRVTITPASPRTLHAVGRTVQLTAYALDGRDDTIPLSTFVWATSNPAVATVDGLGLVTATGPGDATITATDSGITASAGVSIRQVVAAVSVVPASVHFGTIARTIQLVATPRDSGGFPVPGKTVNWATAQTGIVVVTTDGRAISAADGSATITASVDNVTTSVPVTVQVVVWIQINEPPQTLAPGQTFRYTVQARDTLGHQFAAPPLTWWSTNNVVMTVDQSGLVTAHSPGMAQVMVSGNGFASSSLVTVQ